jgi:hypothetical protein
VSAEVAVCASLLLCLVLILIFVLVAALAFVGNFGIVSGGVAAARTVDAASLIVDDAELDILGG